MKKDIFLCYDQGHMSAVASVSQVVDGVLRSKTFSSAPSSRRLLKYLAERTFADDPELKEYSVGVDVFGKSPGYDPQRDSTVRIQVGRLRQRLVEYYQDEGRLDPVILDIPKGSFRLSVAANPHIEETPAAPEVSQPAGVAEVAAGPRRHLWLVAAVGLAALCVGVGVGVFVRPSEGTPIRWSGELDEIWRPLVANPRPLLIVYSTPLFVELQGTMLFRDRGEENWERALGSERVQAVRGALGDPAVRPTHYYAAAGEVGAAFSLARALGTRKASISLVRDVQFSWPQLADNNVIFLGPPRFFRDRLGNLPMELEILPEADRFRVAHPRAGEPESFSKTGVQGDGEAFVLVTHGPGPGGKGSIFSFMSNDTFARQGAVQAFTDPDTAGALVAGLREGGGRLPAYYQVMLRVRLKGSVATETRAVLHRRLGG